jgi:hypothetical protein
LKAQIEFGHDPISSPRSISGGRAHHRHNQYQLLILATHHQINGNQAIFSQIQSQPSAGDPTATSTPPSSRRRASMAHGGSTGGEEAPATKSITLVHPIACKQRAHGGLASRCPRRISSFTDSPANLGARPLHHALSTWSAADHRGGLRGRPPIRGPGNPNSNLKGAKRPGDEDEARGRKLTLHYTVEPSTRDWAWNRGGA